MKKRELKLTRQHLIEAAHALNQYGDHKDDCAALKPDRQHGGECSCGYESYQRSAHEGIFAPIRKRKRKTQGDLLNAK